MTYMNTGLQRKYLFGDRAAFHQVVEYQESLVKKALDDLGSKQISQQPIEEIVAEFTEKFSLDVPTLLKTVIVQLPNKEIDIDVSQNSMYPFIEDRSKPYYVKGTLMRIAIPFEGDPEGFKYGQTPYPYGNPVEGEVVNNRVILSHA